MMNVQHRTSNVQLARGEQALVSLGGSNEKTNIQYGPQQGYLLLYLVSVK
jgi:hypothetical protein